MIQVKFTFVRDAMLSAANLFDIVKIKEFVTIHLGEKYDKTDQHYLKSSTFAKGHDLQAVIQPRNKIQKEKIVIVANGDIFIMQKCDQLLEKH